MAKRTRPVYHKPVQTNGTTGARAQRLRGDMSLPEVLLWRHLKNKNLVGLRFRRQHPLGPYIADFYCHEATLVVEIDGAVHQGDQRSRDEQRDAWLRRRGLFVLRFTAVQVLREMESVLRTIEREASRRLAEQGQSLPPPPAAPAPPPSVTGED